MDFDLTATSERSLDELHTCGVDSNRDVYPEFAVIHQKSKKEVTS